MCVFGSVHVCVCVSVCVSLFVCVLLLLFCVSSRSFLHKLASLCLCVCACMCVCAITSVSVCGCMCVCVCVCVCLYAAEYTLAPLCLSVCLFVSQEAGEVPFSSPHTSAHSVPCLSLNQRHVRQSLFWNPLKAMVSTKLFFFWL